jgi:RNA polymerase II subunit A C-terminal domain phosphatase
MVAANSLALEAQLEERPLARKQEALLDDGAAKEAGDVSMGDGKNDKAAGKEKADEKPAQVKKALLKNDDTELLRVNKVRLQIIFYFSKSSSNTGDYTGARRGPRTVLQCI